MTKKTNTFTKPQDTQSKSPTKDAGREWDSTVESDSGVTDRALKLELDQRQKDQDKTWIQPKK